MPVLDEAAIVEAALQALAPLRAPGVEVVVVDGGSRDATAALAAPWADAVVAGPRGRAAQMNAGAQQARGSVLLFLHIDTALPADADALVAAALAGAGAPAPPGAQWGRFDVRITGRSPWLGVVAALMNRALAAHRHRDRRPGDLHDARGLRRGRRLSRPAADGGRRDVAPPAPARATGLSARSA